ncbi:MAG: hypothetical protein BM556_08345 [Bacteriovorax sp. MedPE-SWde]|nr:MAG: hypothetical protein BM556_08345 [Bacteriovorax sp. MedPE-SWde]
MANTNINKTVKELEQLYLDAKYDDLRNKLVNDRDSLSPGLFHYNLGTTLAKQGNLAAARYNLEKSKILGFEHPALSKNLKSVLNEIEVKVSPDQSLGATSLKEFTSTSESVLLLIALIICLLAAVTYRFKVFKSKVVAILILILAFTPFLIKKYHYSTNYIVGINLKESKVFEGPSEIYPVLKSITEGQKLILGKSFEDWIYISWPQEHSGWMKRKELGVL